MDDKKGSIVLCEKPNDENYNIIGKLGLVREVYQKDIAYYGVEFFEDIDGHGAYGKQGHCWTVSEDCVIKKEGAENVTKNLIFI